MQHVVVGKLHPHSLAVLALHLRSVHAAHTIPSLDNTALHMPFSRPGSQQHPQQKNKLLTYRTAQVGLVLENSPAQAAGVEAGDIVLEVNGVDAAGKTKE